MNKNINLVSFKKNNKKIYLNIEDKIVINNFEKYFRSYFSRNNNFTVDLIADPQADLLVENAAKLSIQGWAKEAVPVVQTKNSLISRIFKTLFG